MYRTRVHPKQGTRPTRDDVARHANISGATVSRVLSGRTDLAISPETRERVLASARLLGYQPNSAARALTIGRTGIIGLWMSLAYSPYRSQVMDQMRTMLHGTEVAMAVIDVDEQYNEARNFERALRVPADGIIAFDNSASVEAFGLESDRLAPTLPFVSMGAYWSERRSFVGVDLRGGADAAMRLLTSLGHRSIAYVAPWTTELVDSGPRYEAYATTMRESGLEPQTLSMGSVTVPSVRTMLDEARSKGPLPTAIFCMNDDIALTCSNVLQSQGVVPGKDIAIVGFDGIAETGYASVPITTVRQPVEAMCRTALDFLRAQIEGSVSEPQQTLITPSLIIRESTGTSLAPPSH